MEFRRYEEIFPSDALDLAYRLADDARKPNSFVDIFAPGSALRRLTFRLVTFFDRRPTFNVTLAREMNRRFPGQFTEAELEALGRWALHATR